MESSEESFEEQPAERQPDITRPAAKRLQNRAGGRALSSDAQKYLPTALLNWAESMLRDINIIREYFGVKTIQEGMVTAALSIHGVQVIATPKKAVEVKSTKSVRAVGGPFSSIPLSVYRRIIFQYLEPTPEVRVSKSAFDLLQLANENYLVQLIDAAAVVAPPGGAVTEQSLGSAEKLLLPRVLAFPFASINGAETLEPVIREWYTGPSPKKSAVTMLSKLLTSFLRQIEEVANKFSLESEKVDRDQANHALRIISPIIYEMINTREYDVSGEQTAVVGSLLSSVSRGAVDVMTQAIYALGDEILSKAAEMTGKNEIGSMGIVRAIRQTWISSLFPAESYVL